MIAAVALSYATMLLIIVYLYRKGYGIVGKPELALSPWQRALLGSVPNSYPKDDGRNGKHRPVVDGALLMTCGYPPELQFRRLSVLSTTLRSR